MWGTLQQLLLVHFLAGLPIYFVKMALWFLRYYSTDGASLQPPQGCVPGPERADFRCFGTESSPKARSKTSPEA